MNKIISKVLVALIFTGFPMANAAHLDVVDSVDLNRYIGTWYEIARLPNFFQNRCASDVTATYSLKSDGDIKVVNRCKTKNGEVSEAEGTAKKADPKGSSAKLKVRFAPAFLSFLSFVWGDYWVIDLAPDYSYAVIGEPSLGYFWILSRTPKMDDAKYKQILERAAKQGYDTSKVVITKQG